MKKHWILAFVVTLFTMPAALMAQSPSDINQSTWAVSEIAIDDSSDQHLRKISFDSGQNFKLAVDCNYYTGRYYSDRNVLRLDTLNKSESDCHEMTKSDAMFLQLMLRVERYDLSAGVLKLLDGSGELVVTMESTSAFELPDPPKRKSKKKHAKAKSAKLKKTNAAQNAHQGSVKKKAESSKISKKKAAKKALVKQT